jgi:hypothetical protein
LIIGVMRYSACEKNAMGARCQALLRRVKTMPMSTSSRPDPNSHAFEVVEQDP